MYTLKWLIKEAPSTLTECDGQWGPARPYQIGGISRLKDAWAVLVGKADAFTCPFGQ